MTSLFTARQGRPAPAGGPYEGVPDHLQPQITRWLEEAYTRAPGGGFDHGAVEYMAAHLRVEIGGANGYGLFDSLLAWTDYDEERLLDLVHYTLQLVHRARQNWKRLEILLTLGGSVWRATEGGLERRVDQTAMQAFTAATATQDSASDELAKAWASAYGRNPDPGAAWQQSIKAVEAALRPIVCPTNTKATLSNVIGELRSQPWKLNVRGRAGTTACCH